MVARDDAALVAEQQHGKVELLGRQADGMPVAGGRAHGAVEGIFTQPQRGVRRLHRGIGAPQQAFDAGRQFGGAHRLDHVVIGAGGKRADDVLLGIAPAEKHHRHAPVEMRAHPRQHLAPRQVRHRPVEQQQVEARVAQRQQQLAAFREGYALMPAAGDDPADQRRIGGGVFQRCNLLSHVWSPATFAGHGSAPWLPAVAGHLRPRNRRDE
ncbi:hypothetical protein D3C81_1395040 [compost metagenome]